MARTYKRTTIDEKIDKQKEVVSRAKERYDAELQTLEELMEKRNELRNKELLKAIEASGRSFEEIMKFLNTRKSE